MIPITSGEVAMVLFGVFFVILLLGSPIMVALGIAAMASFAMVGDIHIAEKGSLIGFAGARVIESTIRETLPPGFQRAEYLLEHGIIDMVVPRKDLKAQLARVISLLTNRRAPAKVPVRV